MRESGARAHYGVELSCSLAIVGFGLRIAAEGSGLKVALPPNSRRRSRRRFTYWV